MRWYCYSPDWNWPLELSELRNRLLKLALVFALAMVAVWFVIFSGTVLVLYLTWESVGWKVLLIMTLCFAMLAAGLLFYACFMAWRGKLSLPVTMAELKADHDMLL
jgi:uncharacterized membrane protein YqjE